MVRKTNILVVDDEKTLRKFVRKNLEARGYTVHCASTGLEALAVFDAQAVDMMILDVMMPNMDGLETIRRIREKSIVPIIVLSALGEESDKIQALNLGADDYLTKPFGVEELMARVRAVERRSRWIKPEDTQKKITKGEFLVDLDRHEIFVYGKQIDLTPTEFNLLLFLIENAGKMLTHETILHHVWGPEYGQETEYLRVYIGRIRQKVENDPGNPKHLFTERGLGYFFDA